MREFRRGNTKWLVTVLACASAAGNTLPPMFIFKNQSGRVPNGVQEGAPSWTLYTIQKAGWIDKDLYFKWFCEVFLKHIPAECPALLLVDGHKAHVTIDVIQAALDNSIHGFCFPAHTSHLLQPLDLSLCAQKQKKRREKKKKRKKRNEKGWDSRRKEEEGWRKKTKSSKKGKKQERKTARDRRECKVYDLIYQYLNSREEKHH